MGFFVDESKFVNDVILVFGELEKSINERVEIEIKDKKGKNPYNNLYKI